MAKTVNLGGVRATLSDIAGGRKQLQLQDRAKRSLRVVMTETDQGQLIELLGGQKSGKATATAKADAKAAEKSTADSQSTPANGKTEAQTAKDTGKGSDALKTANSETKPFLTTEGAKAPSDGKPKAAETNVPKKAPIAGDQTKKATPKKGAK